LRVESIEHVTMVEELGEKWALKIVCSCPFHFRSTLAPQDKKRDMIPSTSVFNFRIPWEDRTGRKKGKGGRKGGEGEEGRKEGRPTKPRKKGRKEENKKGRAEGKKNGWKEGRKVNSSKDGSTSGGLFLPPASNSRSMGLLSLFRSPGATTRNAC
jgi:hypothetical protein